MKPRHKMGGTLCNHCSVVITTQFTKQVLCKECLEKLVYDYPTFSEYGFTNEEQKKLIAMFPYKEEDYWDKLGVNTALFDRGEVITYHTDVLRTLVLLNEGRNIHWGEWD